MLLKVTFTNSVLSKTYKTKYIYLSKLQNKTTDLKLLKKLLLAKTTSSKCHQSLSKTLLNGKKCSCISPQFQGNKCDALRDLAPSA